MGVTSHATRLGAGCYLDIGWICGGKGGGARVTGWFCELNLGSCRNPPGLLRTAHRTLAGLPTSGLCAQASQAANATPTIIIHTRPATEAATLPSRG